MPTRTTAARECAGRRAVPAATARYADRGDSREGGADRRAVPAQLGDQGASRDGDHAATARRPDQGDVAKAPQLGDQSDSRRPQ
jgi:hypothetical protein